MLSADPHARMPRWLDAWLRQPHMPVQAVNCMPVEPSGYEGHAHLAVYENVCSVHSRRSCLHGPGPNTAGWQGHRGRPAGRGHVGRTTANHDLDPSLLCLHVCMHAVGERWCNALLATGRHGGCHPARSAPTASQRMHSEQLELVPSML